jgi:hypothetical protein
MRLTKRIAIAGSLTLAAGAVVMGVTPAANAFTDQSCAWSSGNAYELCLNMTSNPGGELEASATSWDGGQNFHVQVLSPSGATLCNSTTKANPAGVSSSCAWNFSGTVPSPIGEYCTILWVAHDFEYQNWAETCLDV